MLLRCLWWTFISSQLCFYYITLFLKMQLSLLYGRIFLFLKKIFHQCYLFSNFYFLRWPENTRKYPFTIFGISRSFLLSCMFSRVPGKHLLLRLSSMFYHFLFFRQSAFASVHNYYLSAFVLLTHLHVYIFIMLHLSQIS